MILLTFYKTTLATEWRMECRRTRISTGRLGRKLDSFFGIGDEREHRLWNLFEA